MPEVTAAAQDQSLIQIGLSERLANRGILPMFGFPTRARLLYHKQPSNWPPRQVVDRDLELAVSMFAPGAETVKERTIHTAMVSATTGRRDRAPSRTAIRSAIGPNRIVRQLPACRDGYSRRPACRICASPTGPDERNYHPMDLRQPKGFVSYFSKARDYDGVFDFVPRAARQRSADLPLP